MISERAGFKLGFSLGATFIFYFRRAGILLFCLGLNVACNQEKEKSRLAYPKFVAVPKTELFFGKRVEDQYYNLMDLKDPEVVAWFRAEDSLAERYFAENKLMPEYLSRFGNLENRSNQNPSRITISESGDYFYLKYDDSTKNDKLFFRSKDTSQEVELFDPLQYEDGSFQISDLSPSYDGLKIAIGLKREGEFASTFVVFDRASDELLHEVITNVNPDFGGIEWLPDGSGFIYLYFPVVDKNLPGYKKNSFSVLYKLGNKPDKRTPVFGKSTALNISDDFYPKVKISSSQDKYVIGYVASSGDFYDAYITDIEDIYLGKPNWKSFFTSEDKIYYDQGEIRGNQFIYRQAEAIGNRLCIVDLNRPNFKNPEIIAGADADDPITKFTVTKDAVYFCKSHFGVDVSLYHVDSTLNIAKLTLPFRPGYVSFFGSSSLHKNIGVGMDGWTSDFKRYYIKEDGTFELEDLVKKADYPEFDSLVSEQIMVKSYDGSDVPLSLVYKKGLQRNSKNPVFLYVYGAYGESMSPFFFPMFLDWAAQGGILAFPHVRGGGEKGEEWHVQGMKTLKHNSWKDLVACTEALVDQKWSKPGQIALYTNSAGGITAGMAVNERPDLYASFIAEVPRMNPLGLESSSTSSSTSYLEYGSVRDSLEFFGLLHMDPYQNLVPNKRYPATLLFPSYNDDRIPLWDSGKYIAKLQAYNISENPILMDIDYQYGHDTYKGNEESIVLHSKIFSFVRTNMRD
ncbi:prolyl oligopeptidase family serine peptidase [Flavobacteriaceae bacterium F89]|uniref:prolyl oligopeptidase n=1 Tax=Cerina litoralis TaxID=2874477 RepID=A0AAE3EU73_9FLAO|nr:prolyl oligopeptidase family serine peptidase [Cerina litoralis]MCG2460525.1 prolyl oligopeptidase family serine peptidase [Cerina litoralis]